jgi:uncharacterized protein (TIGR03435 family)
MVLAAQAQKTSSSGPTFEAAAIKLHADDAPGGSPPATVQLGCRGTDGVALTVEPRLVHDIPLGRCVATFIPLQILVAYAYGIPTARFASLTAGAPEWMLFDRFDLQAKADVPTTEAELRQMLRSFLADRFKLQTHWQSKEVEVFSLVAMPGTPKLKQSKDDGECVPAPELPCGNLFMDSQNGFHGQRVPLSALISRLIVFMHMAIIEDRTGLNGLFDISTTGINVLNSPDSALPALPTLLREQLGLALKPDKRLENVLVIDHVEKMP